MRAIRKTTAIAIVSILMMTILIATQPTVSEEGTYPPPIGKYKQLGLTHSLAPSHLTWYENHLDVKGPGFTTELRMNQGFLDSELGSWSAEQPFDSEGDQVIIPGRVATFQAFDLGSDPVYSWGSFEQVRLLERPMWLSADQTAQNGSITISFKDGNSTGQAVYLSKEWLWQHDIHRPDVVHEDGTILTANETDDEQGFIIEVHHFSNITMNPSGLQVLGRLETSIFPHQGPVIWYEDNLTLEVEVGNFSSQYELLIEKGWVDLHIPTPQSEYHGWSIERIGPHFFYSIPLADYDTPTVVVISPIDYEPQLDFPPLPDLYLPVEVPGELFFSLFNLTQAEILQQSQDNPSPSLLIETPVRIALMNVWRITHQFLWDIALGLTENQTNGFVWIGENEASAPPGAVQCEDHGLSAEASHEMPNYVILTCPLAFKTEVHSFCASVAQSVPPVNPNIFLFELLGIVFEPGRELDILEGIADPCELLSIVFAWTDLHILTAVYYAEIMQSSQFGGHEYAKPPTILVHAVQPYRQGVSVSKTTKAIEAMEATFMAAGIEFECTTGMLEVPPGEDVKTADGMRDFSGEYPHALNGILSVILVIRSGKISHSSGSSHGLAPGGGATNGFLTSSSWAYANGALIAYTTNRWTTHEIGHSFTAKHEDSYCWKKNLINYKTIMAATSDPDVPSNCSTVAWIYLRFSFSNTYQNIRPKACDITPGTCP